jgi:hypothetical protein
MLIHSLAHDMITIVLVGSWLCGNMHKNQTLCCCSLVENLNHQEEIGFTWPLGEGCGMDRYCTKYQQQQLVCVVRKYLTVVSQLTSLSLSSLVALPQEQGVACKNIRVVRRLFKCLLVQIFSFVSVSKRFPREQSVLRE